MIRPALLTLIALLAPAGAFAESLTPAAARGLALAEQRCAACHAVRANGTSPHPEAPPWDDVANRPGTSEKTLRQFLRDSHNYPAAMQFRMTRRNAADIAAWMAALRREGYSPGR